MASPPSSPSSPRSPSTPGSPSTAQKPTKRVKEASKRVLSCKYCDDPNDPNPNPRMIEDWQTGDLICEKCGTVAEVLIDQRSEWRTFADSTEDPSRVGRAADPLMEGIEGFASVIDSGDGVAKRLSETHNRGAKSGHQRAVLASFKDIDHFGDRIALSENVKHRAKQNYKKAEEKMRGRSNDGIIGAAILLACRGEGSGVTRTIKEISALVNVPIKELGKCVTKMKSLLESGIQGPTADDLLPRACSNLNLPLSFVKIALHVVQKAKEMVVISSKSPLSVVAAAIYMTSWATGDNKTQKEIAEVVGVAELTIRNTYKDMYTERHTLFPPDFQPVKPLDNLPLN